MIDVERQIILAQWARQTPWNDCATLPTLVGQAQSIIPAKRRSSCSASGVRLQMRENFPTEQYGKRCLIESVFSAVKRKLSCRAPGRTLHTQSRQALLLGLAFNLYRLRLPAF